MTARPERYKPQAEPRRRRDDTTVNRGAIRVPLETLTSITRQADIRQNSFDEASQTFEAVLIANADVERRDRSGAKIIERFDLASINLGDVTGKPFLVAHRARGPEDQLGVIESARWDDRKLVGRIRVSQADDVKSHVTKIREGIAISISVGVLGRVSETRDASGTRIQNVTNIRFNEASLVAFGADPDAKIRSQTMLEETETIEKPEAETPEEKARKTSIQAIARTLDLPQEWADEQIESGADEVAARTAARDALLQPKPTIRASVGTDHTDPGVMLTRMIDAQYCRETGTAPKPESTEFMALGLKQTVRTILEQRGESTRRMSDDQVFQRAIATTDLPKLLLGVGDRSLQAAYQVAASPLKRLSVQKTLADFRTSSFLKISDPKPLQPITESGEIKHVSRTEAGEEIALATFANRIDYTRKSWINDDLGGLATTSAAFGRAAAEREAIQLVTLLTSNPTMKEDNKALFHADHKNIAASGGDIDLDALSDARLALRKTTGLDGQSLIAAAPRFLVVSAERETEAEQGLAAIYAAQTSDANVFASKLEILVEPRLPAAPWYVFASPEQLAVLAHAYLSGASGPVVETQNAWDSLAISFRCYLDFGVAATDFRGAYRNAGA